MSTFNLQEGVEGNERSKPAPNSFMLDAPRKPLVVSSTQTHAEYTS